MADDAVWVIDDCPLTIMLVKARLRALGVRAHALPSGRAAVGAWTTGALPRPSAVLMDLDMQGAHGIEAGRLLRDAGYSGLLLLHTGPASARLVAELDCPLFDGVLVKPVSSDGFARVLKDAAERRSRRTA